MKNILRHTALCFVVLLGNILLGNVAQAGGIVFTFGNNVTPERQAALQAAANDIQQIINFRHTVKVTISFDNLQCDSSSAVLGQAGPAGNIYSNFPQAPQNNVWYVSAQAADLGFATAQSDALQISGSFNTNLGNSGCLDGVTWYFGTDHNPGVNQIDFLGTAVHEFMHGLGFLSLVGSDGALAGGTIDNYSSFLFDNSAGKSWKNMTKSARAASILNSGNLVWNGAKTTAMDSLLSTGTSNGKVRLYAPTSYEAGSSTSHFDTSVHYNSGADEVMEPFAQFPAESIMASAAFCDMGWHLLRDTDGDGINDCDDTDPLVSDDTDGDGVEDAQDAFPFNAAASVDTDGDGRPDSWNQPNPYNCAVDAPTCKGLTLDIKNFIGETSKDKAGASVAFAGDVDGDGYGDYVIGIPGYDIPAAPPLKIIKDVGRAVVVSGKTGQELMHVDGVAAKDALGTAVAGNADIDGDGYPDVVVGAPNAGVTHTGSVTILFGPDGARTQTLSGTVAKSSFGSAVALGDVNNGTHADIIVGAPKDDDVANKHVDAGSVTVLDGGNLNGDPLHVFYGATTKAHAGTSVATGKVDAVAGVDIIIGAPNDDDVANKHADAGSVTVYNIADPNTPVMQKYGAVAKAYLGKSVAAGDVNKDGFDDVLAGAPGDNNGTLKGAGSVTVFFANNALPDMKKFGAVAKVGLGNSVAAGDVDGDGYADIIAGAWKDDKPTSNPKKPIKDAGSVTVWSGNGYAQIGTTHYGSVAKDYLGFSVSAGDTDGDGKDDLIIGVPGFDAVPTLPATKLIKDAGLVQLLSGAGL